MLEINEEVSVFKAFKIKSFISVGLRFFPEFLKATLLPRAVSIIAL